ncbi:MAG: hypothetical protein WCW13_03420 [archaeon]
MPTKLFHLRAGILEVELEKIGAVLEELANLATPPTKSQVSKLARRVRLITPKLNKFMVQTITYQKELGEEQAKFLRHRLKNRVQGLSEVGLLLKLKHKSVPVSDILGRMFVDKKK